MTRKKVLNLLIDYDLLHKLDQESIYLDIDRYKFINNLIIDYFAKKELDS